jgi:ring-1,2-phenylacetyl-CoA epoxidase subunit PaaE
MTSVAFASDSGIVPALAVVNRLLTEKPDQHVWFFCGHRAGEHPEALEQLLALKDLYLHRLAVGVVTDREPDEAELLAGQLDSAKVHALATRLFNPATVQEYIVCGSDTLAADVNAALAKLGVEPRRIRVEQVHAAGAAKSLVAAPGSAAETQVSFVMDGRRRSFGMHTDQETILDAAARAGIDLPFSCKAGVCSTCRTKLVTGKVVMAENYALEDWELEQGFILACQSRAQTPQIELTYDET